MYYISNFLNRMPQKVEMASNAVEFVHDKLTTINRNTVQLIAIVAGMAILTCPLGEGMCSKYIIGNALSDENIVFYFRNGLGYLLIYYLEVGANRILSHYNAADTQKNYAKLFFGISKVYFLTKITFMHFIFVKESLSDLKANLKMKLYKSVAQ